MTDIARTLLPTDLLIAALSTCRGKRALAVIELTNFDELKSQFGVDSRAELISVFQRHVGVLLRPQDSLIELTSEKLVLIFDDLIDVHHLKLAGMKLERIFEQPLDHHEQQAQFKVCGGFLYIARSSIPAEETGGLLERSEAALALAKSSDNGEIYHVITLEDEQEVENHWQISLRLRNALQEHHIYMDYQPKINLANGELVGAEALVRWRDKGAVLPPSDYLPALQSDLMWELTVYCFRRVLRDILDHNISIPIAVNFDPVTINEPELIPLLQRETSLWGVDPSQLILEITEVSDLLNLANAKTILSRIRELGFKISIDDFGSGHSNMERVKSLPIDELKIDRCFCGSIKSDEQNRLITKSIIDLAKQLNVQTVAEGIEDAETLEVLAEWGCDIGQGFYLSAPLPINSLQELAQ